MRHRSNSQYLRVVCVYSQERLSKILRKKNDGKAIDGWREKGEIMRVGRKPLVSDSLWSVTHQLKTGMTFLTHCFHSRKEDTGRSNLFPFYRMIFFVRFQWCKLFCFAAREKFVCVLISLHFLFARPLLNGSSFATKQKNAIKIIHESIPRAIKLRCNQIAGPREVRRRPTFGPKSFVWFIKIWNNFPPFIERCTAAEWNQWNISLKYATLGARFTSDVDFAPRIRDEGKKTMWNNCK